MSSVETQFIHIYLCRHGESVHNTNRVICGQIDSPLSPRGLEQAQTLGKSLKNQNLQFDKCYSSPLERARNTAKFVTGNENFEIVPELIEIDAGELSHLTVSELNEKMPKFQSHGLYPDLCYPGGESLLALEERTIKWFQNEFSKAEMGKKYLVVGHWGTLNIILNHLFKIPIHYYSAFYLNNCELTHVTISDNQLSNPQLQKLNFI